MEVPASFLFDAKEYLAGAFYLHRCDLGVFIIQDALGHKDISTMLNIYTDVTKELKRSEFEWLDLYFKNE